MARRAGPSTCSFCGKDRDQTQRLVAGPSGVYSCAACVNVEIARGVGAKVLARIETLSPGPPSMPLRSGQAHALPLPPLPPLPAPLCALPSVDDIARRPPAAAW